MGGDEGYDLSFWNQWCPRRGPALTHAHSSDCKPPSNHPGGVEVHTWSTCCHCGLNSAQWHNDQTKPSPPVRREAPDHEYVFTIAGLCGRHGCEQIKDVHPVYQRMPPAPGECAVNHDSIKPKRLIGDGGEVWSTCPGCDRMLEPKVAVGEPGGKRDGIGRGWVSPRMRRRWSNIKARFAVLGPDDLEDMEDAA